jgi:hypothetical protein
LEPFNFDASLRTTDSSDVDKRTLGGKCEVDDVCLSAFEGTVIDDKTDLLFFLQERNILDHVKHCSSRRMLSAVKMNEMRMDFF